MPEQPVNLLPLYRIDGWISTLGPLRIGDGLESRSRVDLPGKGDKPVSVQTVCTDCDNRAYLPATSFRGFLRAYAQSRVTNADILGPLFGYQKRRSRDEEFAEALGGLLTLWDARADVHSLPARVEEPFWNVRRATCVASHVALNRHTRTAAAELLFFEEYVPRGVRFPITFLLEGGKMNGLPAEAFAAVLLQLLDELSSSSARLGASHADGWGHVEWKLGSVRQMSNTTFREWSARPETPLLDHYQTVPRPAPPHATWFRTAARELRFEVKLQLNGPFLVNDPDHSKQKGRPGDADSGKPNHYALREGLGLPLLPSSSVHGALRAQAERIARTLAGKHADTLVFDPSRGLSHRPPTVRRLEDLSALDAVSCLFGAPGWRSPLRVTEFHLAPNSGAAQAVPQEFVAIDRFTGGGADARKFNAVPFVASGSEPVILQGAIALDLASLETLFTARDAPRMGEGAQAGWAGVLWLFKYLLRDLAEGDISFGSGRSKGYGACTAAIKQTPLPDLPANTELSQALRIVFPTTPMNRSTAL